MKHSFNYTVFVRCISFVNGKEKVHYQGPFETEALQEVSFENIMKSFKLLYPRTEFVYFNIHLK